MTAILKDGDYCFAENGTLLEVKGREALIESALLRLKARKGGFSLDPSLGSELYRLDLKIASDDRLFALITEALAPMEKIQVTGVEKVLDLDNQRITITVQLKLESDPITLSFDGNEMVGVD